MNIPDSVLSNFAKMANLSNPNSKEFDIYATVVNVAENGKDITVLIDGSDSIRTPCITTVECSVGDRVIVSFKNREAVVTSNLTKKMITVAQLIAQRADIDVLLAKKATVEELNAQRAEIDTLLAKKATVDELNAQRAEIDSALVKKLEVKDLKTDNIEIKGKLIGSTGTFNGDISAASGSFGGAISSSWNNGTMSGTVRVADKTVNSPLYIQYQIAGGTTYILKFYSDGTMRLTSTVSNAYTSYSADGVAAVGSDNKRSLLSTDGYVYDKDGRCIHSSDTSIVNFTFANSSSQHSAYINATSKSGNTLTNWGIDIWSSDRNLKKGIKKSYVRAINVIKKIVHRTFKWKDNGVDVPLGYIAQEIEEVIPGSAYKPEGGYYQVRSSAIIPYLSKAIQEQQDQIEYLEARIKVLEEKLNGKTEDHTVPTEKE